MKQRGSAGTAARSTWFSGQPQDNSLMPPDYLIASNDSKARFATSGGKGA
jgi:hypothetical protein